MADGIGRILGGGNSYGLGYVPHRKEKHEEELPEQQKIVETGKDNLVTPDRVLEFMENNNLTITPKTSETVQLSESVQKRAENAMAEFEVIYQVVKDEFGDKAPLVMNMIMDKLMAIC